MIVAYKDLRVLLIAPNIPFINPDVGKQRQNVALLFV